MKNRRALEGLLAQRLEMLAGLKAMTGIDASNSVDMVKEEIAIVEAGLEKLKPPPR